MAAALLKILLQRDFGPGGPREEEEEGSLEDDAPSPRRERADVLPPQGEIRRKERREPCAFSSHRHAARARLSFNVGRRLQVAPGDLVGAIAGETGIPGRSIGAIEIHDNLSFVDVPGELADEIMKVMNTAQIRGFRVTVKRASPKERRPPRTQGKNSTGGAF
jgi:ATP-dependent RNA helicase DeaD